MCKKIQFKFWKSSIIDDLNWTKNTSFCQSITFYHLQWFPKFHSVASNVKKTKSYLKLLCKRKCWCFCIFYRPEETNVNLRNAAKYMQLIIWHILISPIPRYEKNSNNIPNFQNGSQKVMRWPGIEPGSTAWKATMLTITPPSHVEGWKEMWILTTINSIILKQSSIIMFR